VKDVVNKLLFIFRQLLSNSFFPVLRLPVEVDSAFEGWSPREEDIVYRVLVPMIPPRGHIFYVEMGTVSHMQVRYSRIRVELECTCAGEGLVEDMLCFLHHPEEELRRNQSPRLLHTLCTGSYLDVEKTARWMHQLVKAAWVVLPESSQCRLKMFPPHRSCKFQIKKRNNKKFLIELMFGVQRCKSDVFVSNQSAGAIFTPRTMWLETYVVAEMKFFSHVARQAPRDSFHLKCLQLCAHILVGTSFSTYFLKTIVMHLLTSIPVSDWRRRDFLMRLLDIMQYLRYCLEEKRLDHFFFGNENMPEEITLPPAFQTATPPNLFQHLEEDPAAHAEALREFTELQDR
ncbi:Inositol 1,4,5-trisphosphate receptor-interacting protein-like 1, partial [Antrostomus carolinensis]